MILLIFINSSNNNKIRKSKKDFLAILEIKWDTKKAEIKILIEN